MTIERVHGGAYLVRGGDYGRGRGTLVQTDWDFPSVAQALGWSLQRVQKRGTHTVHLARRPVTLRGYIPTPVPADQDCPHYGTDGTVDCACGVKAGEFIRAAAEYLDRWAS